MSSKELADAVIVSSIDTLNEASSSRVWRYNCELSPRHIDAVILAPVAAAHAPETYHQWFDSFEGSDDKLGHLARWIDETMKQIPGGIDMARDVDGGGFTKDEVSPSLFTRWVSLENGTHVRFAQARTAMHNNMLTLQGPATGGALRSPVMGGVVMEATSSPDSTDPRDAISLAIVEFSKEEDARYPWIKPRPGRLFDMTMFTDRPYFVGPLYNGHPNEITDPQVTQKAIGAALETLRLTVDLHETSN